MSLKNKFFSILTVAIALVAFSTFTFAQDDRSVTPVPDKEKSDRLFKGDRGEFGKHGDHGKGFGHRHGGMMRMLHDLNLTEAQKTQIHSIMEANKPDQATHEEMHTLFEAKQKGTLTAEQQSRLETLRQQGEAKMKTIHEQILNVLTAEQRAQLEQKKAEMKQRREEFRKNHQQTPNADTTDKTTEN